MTDNGSEDGRKLNMNGRTPVGIGDGKETTVDGLVIRALPSGDNDRTLTLLTADRGKIIAVAKGSRSVRSKLSAVCQSHVWGNFELHRKNGYFWVRDASVLNSFRGADKKLEGTYLAQYVMDVCCELSGEDVPGEDILRPALNVLHSLDRDLHPMWKLKSAFELKAASASGYEPGLHRCIRCGREESVGWYLDVMNGGLVCRECHAAMPEPVPVQRYEAVPTDPTGTRRLLLPVPPGTLAAMRYVLASPMPRMLSFDLREASDREAMDMICESYLLNHLERGFSSLKMYRELLKM